MGRDRSSDRRLPREHWIPYHGCTHHVETSNEAEREIQSQQFLQMDKSSIISCNRNGADLD